MNNTKVDSQDRNIIVMKMALNLEQISEESIEGFRNHVNQYLTHIRQYPEDEFSDVVVNEAINLYNNGKRTPGVMTIINAKQEYDNAIYNLGYQNTGNGNSNGNAKVRTNGHPVPIQDDYIEPNRNGNAAFSSAFLIIDLTIVLGILLGLIVICLK